MNPDAIQNGIAVAIIGFITCIIFVADNGPITPVVAIGIGAVVVVGFLVGYTHSDAIKKFLDRNIKDK
jgi:hypothetical protein